MKFITFPCGDGYAAVFTYAQNDRWDACVCSYGLDEKEVATPEEAVKRLIDKICTPPEGSTDEASYSEPYDWRTELDREDDILPTHKEFTERWTDGVDWELNDSLWKAESDEGFGYEEDELPWNAYRKLLLKYPIEKAE